MIETRGQKIFFVIVFLILLLGTVSARPYIHIVGSSALYPFTLSVAESFHLKTQQPTPIIESTGTGGGLKVFCTGVGHDFPDIVLASRPITAQERAYCSRQGVTELTEIILGVDGIVIATTPSQTLFSLDRATLYKALVDQMAPPQFWSDINPRLPHQKIRVLGPSSTSGTRETFTAFLFQGQSKKMRRDKGYNEVSNQETETVQKLQLEPQALAILSFGYLKANQDRLLPFPIDDISPTIETIQNGLYPVSRLMYMYVKNAHLTTVPGLKIFLTEYMAEETIGPEGYLIPFGFIPLREEQRLQQQDKVDYLLQAAGEDPA